MKTFLKYFGEHIFLIIMLCAILYIGITNRNKVTQRYRYNKQHINIDSLERIKDSLNYDTTS